VIVWQREQRPRPRKMDIPRRAAGVGASFVARLKTVRRGSFQRGVSAHSWRLPERIPVASNLSSKGLPKLCLVVTFRRQADNRPSSTEWLPISTELTSG
jgi:hypothetical protein